jgi:hypothetical protein
MYYFIFKMARNTCARKSRRFSRDIRMALLVPNATRCFETDKSETNRRKLILFKERHPSNCFKALDEPFLELEASLTTNQLDFLLRLAQLMPLLLLWI